MKLDRNQLLGIVLLFGIFMLWSMLNAPSREELLERKRIQDSLAMAAERIHVPDLPGDLTLSPADTVADTVADATRDDLQLTERFGPFAPAAEGTEQSFVLENDRLRITLSNKGGQIREVLVKDYEKILLDEERREYKVPLYLLADEKNTFEYLLPVAGRTVRTSDLYFDATTSGNTVTFSARGQQGAVFTQTYALEPGSHILNYDISVSGLDDDGTGRQDLKLRWVNYLDKVEKNYGYEKYFTTVYYRELNSDSPGYCSCRKDDTDALPGKPLKWVSHSNQFFNSTLIANDRFAGGVMSTEMLGDDSPSLKILTSEIDIPLRSPGGGDAAMAFYIGPNSFDELRAFNMNLEDIIPYGFSIFGTINRWVIRPIFNMLSSIVPSAALVILLLTLLVKLLLYPLTYKMLHSQAKMGVLKPHLAGLREKHKDDMQKQQMETMKIYREYGVNPLGGCLPMVLQMPIWFALYRFFPAAIEFRQEGFLWATDLSSYDVFVNLPFHIPFYGAHISMFTLLWAVSMVIYTYYNMRHMDMGAMNNPMFKYMQYLMPVMLLFFFNNYASGLTLYLLFSNLINIGLTLGTKHFIFDDEKIMAELNLNKAKPKKKSGFAERLEKAMKEQQRIAAERQRPKTKK